MKKKEKAELENTQSDDVPVAHHLAINPRVDNRRVPTKAAMIGLAISMGATSLLVTRQSDRAIAAPVSNQNTASTIPVASETEVNLAPAKEQKLVTVSEISIPESPSIVEPTAISQVAELRAKWQGVARGRSVQPTDRSQAVSTLDALQPEVNAQLKAQQEFALNKLQEKSTRIRKSLKEWRSNQTNELLPVKPVEIQQVTVQEKMPQTITKETVAELTTSSNAGRERLVSRLKTRVGSKEVPASTTTTTSVEKTKQAPTATSYEVKPGDTLAEIANNYGTSVSNLVKVNDLNNANQLQINQKLTIPVAENSSSVDLPEIALDQNNAGSLSNAKSLNDDNSIANNSIVTVPTPIIAPDSIRSNNVTQTTPEKSIDNNSIGVKAPVADNSIQTKTESEVAGAAQRTPTTKGINSYYGVGGDTPVPTVFTEIKEAQRSNSATTKVKKNQRLRSLQAEIDKLREKYRAQQSGNIVVSEVSETKSASVELSESNQDDRAVPISVPTFNSTSVEVPTSRRNDGAIPIPVPKPMTSNRSRQQAKPLSRGNRKPIDEPVNPELLRTSPVATPSISGVNGTDALGTMRGTSVSPELPPLAAVDRYLPRPIDETLPPPSSSANYIWPAKGVLTSGYGPRWGRMHKGIDIASSTGTPIYAASEGVVERAGWNNGGYGYLVDIRHPDGTMTRYGHNSRILVQPGQLVQQGQQISAMGSTGFSTGPHLHFEIHASGKGAVNPVAFLPQQRV